jgi:hypothetical protein
MPRLLKRPFAFWLPAFGLLFLLWSWADSCYHTTTVYLGYTGADSFVSCSMRARSSALVFNSATASGSFAVGRPRKASPLHAATNRYEVPIDSSSWWFPLPDITRKHETAPSRSIPGRTYQYTELSVSIPHWCLIPAYLALWWAALRWHSRRVNKLRQTQLAQAA